jgi:hypothetical protein
MEWCAVSTAGCHNSADDVDGLADSRGADAGHDEDAEPFIWPDAMVLRNSGAPVSWDVLLDVGVSELLDVVV